MLVALFDRLGGRHPGAPRCASRSVIPQIDGRRLDDVVDFLNYVVVPGGLHGLDRRAAALRSSAAPVLASAYGFAQQRRQDRRRLLPRLAVVLERGGALRLAARDVTRPSTHGLGALLLRRRLRAAEVHLPEQAARVPAQRRPSAPALWMLAMAFVGGLARARARAAPRRSSRCSSSPGTSAALGLARPLVAVERASVARARDRRAARAARDARRADAARAAPLSRRVPRRPARDRPARAAALAAAARRDPARAPAPLGGRVPEDLDAAAARRCACTRRPSPPRSRASSASDYAVALGMRYGAPRVDARARRAGRRRRDAPAGVAALPAVRRGGDRLGARARLRSGCATSRLRARARARTLLRRPGLRAAWAARRASRCSRPSRPDHVLFSYHGLPERQMRAADPTRPPLSRVGRPAATRSRPRQPRAATARSASPPAASSPPRSRCRPDCALDLVPVAARTRAAGSSPTPTSSCRGCAARACAGWRCCAPPSSPTASRRSRRSASARARSGARSAARSWCWCRA